jgi:hypothetical protein
MEAGRVVMHRSVFSPRYHARECHVSLLSLQVHDIGAARVVAWSNERSLFWCVFTSFFRVYLCRSTHRNNSRVRCYNGALYFLFNSNVRYLKPTHIVLFLLLLLFDVCALVATTSPLRYRRRHSPLQYRTAPDHPEVIFLCYYFIQLYIYICICNSQII